MRMHILGVCGTFMGGLALLARELGFQVSGSDANVYPPMSTQLEQAGITLMEGYLPAHLQPAPDVVVVGNAMSRGNPAIEYLLDAGIPYTSGPQWLAEHVLQGRWVLAVSGTHGKTTTTSLLAWILETAGLRPGFLIGGVAENFGLSARLGEDPFFVVEADEYDTAFFDKRSKFVHYRPRTLIINNLEYDHADIFPDLDAIKRQFHHLVRTVPHSGLIVTAHDNPAIEDVLSLGCWTPRETVGEAPGAAWQAVALAPDYSRFELRHGGGSMAEVQWPLIGRYNAANALAAIAAARHAGVPPAAGAEALAAFRSVKRRLQQIACIDGVTVYDDFAHHPTAVSLTLEALRQRVGSARIIALLEPRSNTMKLGVHKDTLAAALSEADLVGLLQPPGLDWDLAEATGALGERRRMFDEIGSLIAWVVAQHRSGDHVLIMSNGAFGGIHGKLVEALRTAARNPAVSG